MITLIVLCAVGYLQAGYHLVGKGTLADYRKRKGKGPLVTMAYPFRAYLKGREAAEHPLESVIGNSEAERRFCRRMSLLWPYVLGKGLVAGAVIGSAEAPGCLIDAFYEGPGRIVRRLRGVPAPRPLAQIEAAHLEEVENALDPFRQLEAKKPD